MPHMSTRPARCLQHLLPLRGRTCWAAGAAITGTGPGIACPIMLPAWLWPGSECAAAQLPVRSSTFKPYSLVYKPVPGTLATNATVVEPTLHPTK